MCEKGGPVKIEMASFQGSQIPDLQMEIQIQIQIRDNPGSPQMDYVSALDMRGYARRVDSHLPGGRRVMMLVVYVRRS